MKHLFLIVGVSVIAYTLWQKSKVSGTGTGTDGLTSPTGIAVSPATLVVPGATGRTGDTSCGPCDTVASIASSSKGLGTDSRINTPVGRYSPDSFSYSFGREDFSGVNPFTM